MPTVAIQSGVPNVVTTPSNEAAAKPVRRAIWLSPFGLLLPQEQPLVSLRRQPRPPSPPSQGFGADRRRQPARDCPCRVLPGGGNGHGKRDESVPFRPHVGFSGHGPSRFAQ